MILTLAAAMTMQSNIPNTWQMGGGRAWMNPPAPASTPIPSPPPGLPPAQANTVEGRTWLVPPKLPPCLSNGYCFTAKDLRETDASREAERREGERILKLAKKGHVREMARAGYMLLNGLMVPKDEAAAMGWFYEAALRGEGMSMYALGCGFKDGVGVAPDPKLAAYWQRRAAAKGFTKEC